MRRGLCDPAEARAFLDLEGPLHDPLRARRDGRGLRGDRGRDRRTRRRIVVHGDYDVDGVCATDARGRDAARARRRRRLASAEPLRRGLRRRRRDGRPARRPGRGADPVRRLRPLRERGDRARDGARRRRRRLRPPPPGAASCPTCRSSARAAPTRRRYPFSELCGAGVVFKLAQALWARRLGHDRGARRAAAQARPGRARDDRGRRRAARREPRARARRAAPPRPWRAAGARRADGGLGHRSRAAEARPISASASGRGSTRPAGSAIRARRSTCCSRATAPRPIRSRAGSRSATASVSRSSPRSCARPSPRSRRGLPERRDARGYVVAGEGWHAGVIGIVASRLVERYGRPVVVIALDGERGTGSGRSVPAFDLHAGLAACRALLERFGGHRAAAGLDDRRRPRRCVQRGVRGPRRRGARRRRARAARACRRDRGRGRALARARAGARAARAPRHRQPRAAHPGARRAARGRSRRWAPTASTCACRSRARARAAAPSPSAAASRSTRCGRRASSTSSAGIEAHSFRGALSQRLSLVDLREVADHDVRPRLRVGAASSCSGPTSCRSPRVLDEGPARARRARGRRPRARGHPGRLGRVDLRARERPRAALLRDRRARSTPRASGREPGAGAVAARRGGARGARRARGRHGARRGRASRVRTARARCERPSRTSSCSSRRCTPRRRRRCARCRRRTTMHLAYGARDLAAARAAAEREAPRPLMAALWRAGEPGERVAPTRSSPPPTGRAAGSRRRRRARPPPRRSTCSSSSGSPSATATRSAWSRRAGAPTRRRRATYARAEARRRDALERIARAGAHQSRAPAASTM